MESRIAYALARSILVETVLAIVRACRRPPCASGPALRPRNRTSRGSRERPLRNDRRLAIDAGGGRGTIKVARAKSDVSALLNRLDGERVGLIAFAGQAVVKCPLTADYDAFRRSLQELDPSSAPKGGTAIGDAIRKGLEVFSAQADRDQAILLITDGDDQQSYPLEAAAIAAERNVTIFTVGLGDSSQGSRIPQRSGTGAFVEYQGEQVWSKLDGSLLSEIALKTSGVYVPAGTKSYDLGELYSNHLRDRRASDALSQQRIRRSEQYQVFLAIALACFLLDAMIGFYRKTNAAEQGSSMNEISKRASLAVLALVVSGWLNTGVSLAVEEPVDHVRLGLKLYSQEKYDVAREKFTQAVETLTKDQKKDQQAAVAAFDEGCAYHRQGEIEKARESYLKAGLSQNKSLATASHFNLGNLAAENARKKAGPQPELVQPDKRKEILDELSQAIAAYRHCLELHPDHTSARRNLELIRLWIKHYSDRWKEIDRQKRREEMDLLSFVDFLMEAESELRQSIADSPSSVSADTRAEWKRMQEELAEEIDPLKEKIEKELLAPEQPNGEKISEEEVKQREQGVAMLKSWAENAKQKMLSSGQRIASRDFAEAMRDQQASIDQLDQLWDAIAPFHPLVSKDLQLQTKITEMFPKDEKAKEDSDQEPAKEPAEDVAPTIVSNEALAEMRVQQERSLRKAQLISPKAEFELQQVMAQMQRMQQPKPADKPSEESGKNETTPPTVSPEERKAGFEKAIELAPKAVEQMEIAIKALQRQEPQSAKGPAEEARRILKEILDSQPKDPNQQPNDQDNQENGNDSKEQQNSQDSQDKKDPNKKDPQKKEEGEDKKEDSKQKGEEEKKKEEPGKDEKDPQKQSPKSGEDRAQQNPTVSKDRLEEALRKVREREQEKRERDRQIQTLILGRNPVEKDW